MIVGSPILPCCCGAPEGNCGGLSHAASPDFVSVSGSYSSAVYSRTRGLCNPSCSAYDADLCCDVVTSMTISFQGLLAKFAASSWSFSGNRPLYGGKVEFDWSISQEIVAGNCGGESAHSESGGGSYDDPSSSLPYVRISCCRQAGSANFGCSGPTWSLCTPLSNGSAAQTPSYINPSPLVAVPYLRLQFFTESSNQGVNASAPSRPAYPWAGVGTRWPQQRCTSLGCPQRLQYLISDPVPGSDPSNWWRPSQFAWVKGGSQIGGSYQPVGSQLPMQERVVGAYTICDLSPMTGSPVDPCDPPADYDFAGIVSSSAATVST